MGHHFCSFFFELSVCFAHRSLFLFFLWCEIVRNKRRGVFLLLFFSSPPAHKFLCTGFATIRRLAQQFLSQGSGFFLWFFGRTIFFFLFLADKNGHPPPVNPLQFQMLFTLSAKYFSPFEQSTFALSVSQPIFVTLSKDTPCVGETFQTAFSNKFTPEERKGGEE